jgi:UDP-3-O-[3-hydroxymyristoyl] N-acetylglucosamine deacetylase/3-hydroxyacyl-[acyl-carrier-protein] dehydratase
MYIKQHTIQHEFTLSGQGLHTGLPSTITIKPAPENHGIVFKRVDAQGQPIIPADLDHVRELERSTTIAHDDKVKVHTIEHVMAALMGMQIDNALIEIDGPECPILDGSCKVYTDYLKKVGSLEQMANKEFYVIDEPIHYQNNERNIDLAALPFNDFRVTVMVDYNSRVLGIQHATMVQFEDFETEIGPARTFCFFHELEYLVKQGLIKGGSTDNAIVIVDREVGEAELEPIAKLFNKPNVHVLKAGILNNVELRFSNEPARHKLLDLIGDLALIGSPIKGQILAARPGHSSNIAFGRLIKKMINQKKTIRKYQAAEGQNYVFDINAIQKLLPHRYPFLLVDRILYMDKTVVEGIKNVTINEPFFLGHFEGNPIMPGVLQLEAMAQVGGILAMNSIENPESVWAYIVGIDNARFKKPVIPGDQIRFRLELISLRRSICKMFGRAFVGDTQVAEAELTASFVPKR